MAGTLILSALRCIAYGKKMRGAAEHEYRDHAQHTYNSNFPAPDHRLSHQNIVDHRLQGCFRCARRLKASSHPSLGVL